jgi:hypothetical protein
VRIVSKFGFGGPLYRLEQKFADQGVAQDRRQSERIHEARRTSARKRDHPAGARAPAVPRPHVAPAGPRSPMGYAQPATYAQLMMVRAPAAHAEPGGPRSRMAYAPTAAPSSREGPPSGAPAAARVVSVAVTRGCSTRYRWPHRSSGRGGRGVASTLPPPPTRAGQVTSSRSAGGRRIRGRRIRSPRTSKVVASAARRAGARDAARLRPSRRISARCALAVTRSPGGRHDRPSGRFCNFLRANRCSRSSIVMRPENNARRRGWLSRAMEREFSADGTHALRP